MTAITKTNPIEEFNQIDIVHYLANLGHQPVRIRGNDFWYSSPLRIERTPSFKVNRQINRWFDFGLGRGGDLLSLATEYEGCSISELLKNKNRVQLPPAYDRSQYARMQSDTESKIKLLDNSPLHTKSLLKYLHKRRISTTLATKYCREISYELNNKYFYAVGFPNNAGGFELRNNYSKLSTAPKDISIISQNENNTELAVFEGFMDFLTFRTLYKDIDETKLDFLVLNSTIFFERAKPFMESYDQVLLYLDRDETGKRVTEKALASDRKYQDESFLYQNHKDLNEWITNMGNNKQNPFGNFNHIVK